MLRIELDSNYIIQDSGTSEGTQIKYKKDGYWYKLDRDGKEGLVEYLASKLLSFSDLEKNDYIEYEQVIINGKSGCRSADYLKDGESFITIYRLYYNEFGKNLAEVLARFDSMEERIEHTLSFVKKTTGLDMRDYLAKIITLDRIILNEDRHVNNLAIIGADNGYRVAPIFDNGRSLLTANVSVNWNFDMKENVRRVVAKPFSGSHESMYKYFGKGFNIDITKALKWLKKEKESKERDVLIYQLTHLSDL